tara:strand:+ start:682 stop:1032 length:351 start_codon:yes stop_codon:yes gene_type:complete
MTEAYEKQKETSGAVATIVFIITSLYLFVAHHGFSSLISLKSLGFFVIGMFAAAILIGAPAYMLQRATAKILMKTITDPYSNASINKIKNLGVVLPLVQVTATIYITNRAFQWLMF